MSDAVKALLRAGLVGAGLVSVLALLAGVLAGSWLAMAAVLAVVAVTAAVAGVLAREPGLVRWARETSGSIRDSRNEDRVTTAPAPAAETDPWPR